MKTFLRYSLFFSLITILIFYMIACNSNNPVDVNFMYERTILSELPDGVIPFCENNIPVSGGYHMIMCEDSSDPLGYSAFIKDTDGMYTKVNLLIPDTLIFDSAKLLAMPSGRQAGVVKIQIYLELTIVTNKNMSFSPQRCFQLTIGGIMNIKASPHMLPKKFRY